MKIDQLNESYELIDTLKDLVAELYYAFHNGSGSYQLDDCAPYQDGSMLLRQIGHRVRLTSEERTKALSLLAAGMELIVECWHEFDDCIKTHQEGSLRSRIESLELILNA